MSLRRTEPVPGVYRFSSVYTNWYVLEDGGRLTVIDGGLPGDWGPFCSALRHLGYDLDDIEAVVVTHHHPDHVGNAECLRAAGGRVLAHPIDHPYIRGENHLSRGGHLRFLWHPWYMAYMARLLAKRIMRVAPVEHIEEMHDGQILDVPGSPRVVYAPGNTAGHCALFVESRSLLFSGDALVTIDCTRGRTGPQIIKGPVTEDVRLAANSLDALAATDAEAVLPGHGEPWLDGVAEAVSIAKRRS